MFKKTFIVVGLLVLAFTIPTKETFAQTVAPSSSEDWTGNQLSEEGETLYVPNENQQIHLLAFLVTLHKIGKANENGNFDHLSTWDAASQHLGDYGYVSVLFGAKAPLTGEEYIAMDAWVRALYPPDGITSDFKKKILNDLFNQIPEDLRFSADGDEDLANTWLNTNKRTLNDLNGRDTTRIFSAFIPGAAYAIGVRRMIEINEEAAGTDFDPFSSLKDIGDALARGDYTQQELLEELARIKVKKLNAALETAAGEAAKDAAEAAIAKAVEDSLTGTIKEVICVDSGGFAQVCF